MAATVAAARTEAERVRAWIDALPYVTQTLALPDLHMKDGMEAPSSLVVAARDTIIPHLVSESINDGMGLVATDLQIEDTTVDDLVGVLRFCNRAGALDKATPSPYSWTPTLLEAACRGGAAPLLEHYGLPASFLDAFEDDGRSKDRDLTWAEFRTAVPRMLQSTSLTRSEIGLNFGGNHFLEVQVVDEVADEAALAALGLRPGQVVVMYHLGPGPLGSILSNLHAFRSKPQPHRKAGYWFFRHLLHGGRGREHHRTFAARDRWLTLDPASPQGQAYANVLDVIKNYGFAYRSATVAAIVDAVRDVTGAPTDSNRLVVDMSHNIIQRELVDGEPHWVSRHNCCRPVPGMPGIVAGSHQVASCLTIGPDGCDTGLGGYDHGVGHLIDRALEDGELPVEGAGREVRRLKMTRGTDETAVDEVLPLLARDPLDGAMTTLAEQGMTRAVAYLRPVATLKHTT